MGVISRELSHAKAVSVIIWWLTATSAAGSQFGIVLSRVILMCISWEPLTLYYLFIVWFNFINLVYELLDGILMCIIFSEYSPNSDELKSITVYYVY